MSFVNNNTVNTKQHEHFYTAGNTHTHTHTKHKHSHI